MVHSRRLDKEKYQAGDYYDGVRRYFDHLNEYTVVKIFSGDCYTTRNRGEMLVTILGSCVAACIRDPVAGVGGMNHFLLPGTQQAGSDPKAAVLDSSARYGAYAMEQLINQILRQGGVKQRLEVKLFGGGDMQGHGNLIGSRNAEFARHYIQQEGLTIKASDLGGTTPRRVHYFPDTGEVKLRRLQRREDLRIVEVEDRFANQLRQQQPEGDIDLFD